MPVRASRIRRTDATSRTAARDSLDRPACGFAHDLRVVRIACALERGQRGRIAPVAEHDGGVAREADARRTADGAALAEPHEAGVVEREERLEIVPSTVVV